MPTHFNYWRMLAGLSGFSAVAIGAIAAHALADAQAAIAVERAATYQLLHSLLLVFMSAAPGKVAKLSRWCLCLGILLFSGSIYAKYLLGLAEATKFAPTGGVLLMLGWLSLAFSAKAQAK